MGTNEQNEEEGFITLSLDDGSELECQVITILEVKGQDYIVLLPMDETDDSEEGEVFIYRYFEPTEGEVQLDNIDDDAEFDLVSEAFDEFLDSAEYDELVDEDESDEV